MAKSIKKLLKSFTLIELIIVIAIIAVLGATAFLLLTQWMSKGRDAQRISDLNVIQNALNIQIAQADNLPIPDNYNTVTYTGEIVLYQGKFGSGVVSNLRSLTKVPQDKTNGEYEYSLLSDRMTYKIQAIMENSNYKTTFVQGVLADELYYRYVGKDLRGIIIGNDFVYLPNMFLTGYVNGEYDLGSGMNVFLGNKVGEYVSGGIVDKDDKDGIIAMMTGLGLSINEATSIFSKAIGVITSTSGTTETTQPEDTSRCYYASNELSDAHAEWNSTELKYDTDIKKCYIFGDEDDNAKAACNKWVTDNVTQGGEFVWVPARWFITDGIGTDMKDSFYQRAVSYNGKDYVCRGFAVAKYEMTFSNLDLNPDNSGWNTYAYLTYKDTGGSIVSAPGYSIASLSQSTAVNLCKGIGVDYHLITSNEWMSLVRNIELQGYNWTSGVKGVGGMHRGITEDLNFGCDGNPDGQRAVSSKDSDCSRRIFKISNGNLLRDISGNVWEHVDRGNYPQTITYNVGAGNLCLSSGYWHSNGNPSNTCSSNYGPILNQGSIDIGMGYVRNSTGDDKIFLRGGDANEGYYGGVYVFYLGWFYNSSGAHVGFRCVR